MQLLERDSRSVWHPYTQHYNADALLPVGAAQGALLSTEDGRTFLDMISSWWVNLHGHGSRALADAIHRQCLQLDHVPFAGITHEPGVRLAEELIRRAGMGAGRVFYSDNGSTAVEVALKMAHQFWKNQQADRPCVLTLEGGYHGDTFGAMSLGKSSGFFQAFRELLFEIHSVPVPHTWLGHRATEEEDRILEETQKLLNESGSQISALFVEPLVQGAAGMRFHSVRFLEQLCALVRQHGILIVFDEVMTAFHRLGSLFAFQQTDIIPDILCLSKGITGGILPLGATIAQNRIFDAFLAEGFERALAHGHSFTGNPICCAAALANLTLLDAEDLPARLDALHRSLQSNLQSLLNHPLTSRHRCLGTVAAFDLRDGSAQYGNFAGRPLARFAREAGVLLRPIGNAVYVLPPYCTTASQIDAAFDVVRAWLQKP